RGLRAARAVDTGDGHVAHHVERVPPPGGPAAHRADDDLGHGPHEPLDLEDVQPARARGVDLLPALRRTGARVGVLGLVAVAAPAPDALVAARAEGPAAVLRARTVAGEDDRGDVRAHPGVVEGAVELVDGVRP